MVFLCRGLYCLNSKRHLFQKPLPPPPCASQETLWTENLCENGVTHGAVRLLPGEPSSPIFRDPCPTHTHTHTHSSSILSVLFLDDDDVLLSRREVYERAQRITSAVPHPRTLATILECGGKMHMQVSHDVVPSCSRRRKHSSACSRTCS